MGFATRIIIILHDFVCCYIFTDKDSKKVGFHKRLIVFFAHSGLFFFRVTAALLRTSDAQRSFLTQLAVFSSHACNYPAIDTTVLSVALNSAQIASNGICLCFFAVSMMECRSKKASAPKSDLK